MRRPASSGAAAASLPPLGPCQTHAFAPLQVIVVFVGSLLAGSLFSQAVQLLQNPSSVVRVLGTSAPETASFFCSYLLLQATLTKPIAFLRLGGAPLPLPAVRAQHAVPRWGRTPACQCCSCRPRWPSRPPPCARAAQLLHGRRAGGSEPGSRVPGWLGCMSADGDGPAQSLPSLHRPADAAAAAERGPA